MTGSNKEYNLHLDGLSANQVKMVNFMVNLASEFFDKKPSIVKAHPEDFEDFKIVCDRLSDFIHQSDLCEDPDCTKKQNLNHN